MITYQSQPSLKHMLRDQFQPSLKHISKLYYCDINFYTWYLKNSFFDRKQWHKHSNNESKMSPVNKNILTLNRNILIF